MTARATCPARAVRPLLGDVACWREDRVLVAGGVFEGDELVDLEEGARGLGDADAHAAPARGVGRGGRPRRPRRGCAERVDELLDGGGAEGRDSSAAPVAQVGAGGDGVAQLGGLAQLVLLESAGTTGGRSRRRGTSRSRAAGGRAGARGSRRWWRRDRLVAEHAVGLRCQPPRRVFVEGRHAPERPTSRPAARDGWARCRRGRGRGCCRARCGRCVRSRRRRSRRAVAAFVQVTRRVGRRPGSAAGTRASRRPASTS